jgi:hypothetical protein
VAAPVLAALALGVHTAQLALCVTEGKRALSRTQNYPFAVDTQPVIPMQGGAPTAHDGLAYGCCPWLAQE